MLAIGVLGGGVLVVGIGLAVKMQQSKPKVRTTFQTKRTSIFLAYLQVIFMVGTIKLAWGEVMAQFTETAGTATVSQFSFLDCLLRPSFHSQWLVQCIVPVAVGLSAQVVFGVCNRQKIDPELEKLDASEIWGYFDADQSETLDWEEAVHMFQQLGMNTEESAMRTHLTDMGVKDLKDKKSKKSKALETNAEVEPAIDHHSVRVPKSKFVSWWQGRVLAVRSRPILIFCIVWALTYPGITKNTLEMFNCVDFGDAGEIIAGQRMSGSRLSMDYKIDCNSPEHGTFELLAVANIIVFCVGGPMLLIGYLYKHSQDLQKEFFQARFEYILKGYHRKRWYWEFAVIGRKLAICTTIVFIREDLFVQSLAVAVIISVALISHAHVRAMSGSANPNIPGDIENGMEAASLSVTYLTIVCGISLFRGKLFYQRELYAGLGIFGLNAIVFFSLALMCVLEKFSKVAGTVNKLIGKCGSFAAKRREKKEEKKKLKQDMEQKGHMEFPPEDDQGDLALTARMLSVEELEARTKELLLEQASLKQKEEKELLLLKKARRPKGRVLVVTARTR